MSAHAHTFDLPANPADATGAVCQQCGLRVPRRLLRMRASLDAWTARRHATARLLVACGIDPTTFVIHEEAPDAPR
jgi:hypothetical protein